MSDLSRLLSVLQQCEADHADLLTAIRCGAIVGADTEGAAALAGFGIRLASTLETVRAVLQKQRAVRP